MDFHQAQARFNHLRDQLRDGTISRAEFVQAVAQIMVHDAQDRYWTLDPRTGHWLYFDGRAWVEAPGQAQLPTSQAVAPGQTPPPPYAVEPEGGPNWLLVGIAGLAVLALCLLGLIAAAIVIGVGATGGTTPGAGPTVQVLSPSSGAQLRTNEPVVIQSTATDAQGVTRIELWIDGALADVQTSPAANGQPALTAAQSWTFGQPGSHTIQVRARNRANAEGTSPLIAVIVSGSAGPTVAPTSAVSPSPCANNSAFISDVTVPDGTRVEPGAQVDKVWRLQNTGACEWGAGYRWAFVAGEQMGAPDSVAVPLTAPGQQADLRVVFTAPQAAGTYVSRWQLQDPHGVSFGTEATLSIVVRPVAPTVTPQPTATRTPTISPTPRPVVSFSADKNKVTLGKCTDLRWDVEYVREVWLKEGSDPEYPEVGHKVKNVCPSATTEYVLHIVKYNGESEYYKVTIKVQ